MRKSMEKGKIRNNFIPNPVPHFTLRGLFTFLSLLQHGRQSETPLFSMAQQVFLDESVGLYRLVQSKDESPVIAIPFT